MAKPSNINAESDNFQRAGVAALYQIEKEKSEVREAFQNDPDMEKKVLEFIFGGDPEAVSPLEEIRKQYR